MESATPPPKATAEQPRPEDDRPLRVSEAAWLTRTNDDTVRRWLRDPTYPRSTTATGELATTWQELSTYCAAHGRAEPLPRELLSLDPITARSVMADVGPESPSGQRPGSDPLSEPSDTEWVPRSHQAESVDEEPDMSRSTLTQTIQGDPTASGAADHRPPELAHDLDTVEGLRAALRERDAQLTATTRRANVLRRMLREKIIGSTHARSDAAASDRAIAVFLDADEAHEAGDADGAGDAEPL